MIIYYGNVFPSSWSFLYKCVDITCQRQRECNQRVRIQSSRCREGVKTQDACYSMSWIAPQTSTGRCWDMEDRAASSLICILLGKKLQVKDCLASRGHSQWKNTAHLTCRDDLRWWINSAEQTVWCGSSSRIVWTPCRLVTLNRASLMLCPAPVHLLVCWINRYTVLTKHEAFVFIVQPLCLLFIVPLCRLQCISQRITCFCQCLVNHGCSPVS